MRFTDGTQMRFWGGGGLVPVGRGDPYLFVDALTGRPRNNRG